jgi:alkyl hydroperoxide reductase subunit D
MNIQSLSEKIGDFGKDIRLNLQSVTTPDGTLGLTPDQRAGIALACAFSVKNKELVEALINELNPSSEVVEGAKAAATMMAMNNVYYRFLHLVDDKDFSKMPARLRMNIIGKPPVAKLDFELMSLAVSSINGCGMCMNAHIAEVRKGDVSNEGIQSSIRIAAVIHAANLALTIA